MFLIKFLLMVILEIAAYSITNLDPVIILKVNSPGQTNYIYGSMAGGLILELIVTGLNQDAQKNQVYIGKYPCIIPQINGINGLSLNCQTTKVDLDDANQRLPIVVQVEGKAVSICEQSCSFYYSQNWTPQLQRLIPNTFFPGQMVTWKGQFKISTTIQQDLIGQFIGLSRCDRSQIEDIYQDYITYNSIFCYVSQDIVAGVYEVLVKTKYGNSQNYDDFENEISTLDIQDDYVPTTIVTVQPKITKLSSNKISSNGGIIQIYGKGFSETESITKVYLSTYQLDISIQSIKKTQQEGVKVITAAIPSFEQDNTFHLQGQGLLYTQYSLMYSDCASFFKIMHENKSSYDTYIVQDDIQSSINQKNIISSHSSEYYRGFYKAQVTGKHRFYISASASCSQIYINKTPYNTEYNKLELIAQDKSGQQENYWNYYLKNKDDKEQINSISEPIELDKDQNYYIEIYHRNTETDNFLQVAVEQENSEQAYNSVSALYSIIISYTPINEIIRITIYNSEENQLLTGIYKLNFKSTQTCKSSFISVQATEKEMSERIYDCRQDQYKNKVKRQKVNKIGDILNDEVSEFAGYTYEITFTQYRNDYYRALPQIEDDQIQGGIVISNIKQEQEPCDPISGTFQLAVEINGEQDVFYSIGNGNEKIYDLPFDKSKTLIIDNIQRIVGFKPLIWTEGISSSYAKDGWIYRIKLSKKGFFNKLDNFQILQNNLVSGNGEPSIKLETNIEGSTNLFFDPIPSNQLNTFSNVPQVRVEINDIQSNCEKDGLCDLVIDENVITIINFKIDSDSLTIELSQESDKSIELTIESFTISFAGADCNNIEKLTSTMSSQKFKCTLESDNGSPLLEAGDHYPIVHYKDYGYCNIGLNINAQTIDLRIFSVSPTQTSPNGGAKITVIGTGFPKNTVSHKQFNGDLSLGGVSITPIVISNTQIVFIAPTKVDTNNAVLQIKFNGKTVTYNDLSYDNAMKLTITNLEFTSKSPTFKGLLKITGTNFGTDKTKLNVQLISSDKTYDAVVAETTDTELRCYLRGGMPGEYDLFVFREGYGKSSSLNQNKFNYETVVSGVYTSIDNQNPAAGSESGGTRIKITGRNFIPNETMIFIGNQINWICELDKEASTETELFCITPPKHESYIEPQPIIISTRITLESVTKCQENTECTFEYKESLTPQINFEDDNLIRTQVANSLQKITVSYGSGPFKVLFKGSVNEEVECQLDGDNLTYTVPELPLGEYATYVKGTSGYADHKWITKILFQIHGISPSTIMQGGRIITIKGSGFNKNPEATTTVTVADNPCTYLTVTSPTEIKCRTPVLTTGSKIVKVSQFDVSVTLATPLTVQGSLSVSSTSQPTGSTLTGSASLQFSTTLNSNVFTGDSSTVAFTINGSNLDGTVAKVLAEYQTFQYEGTVTSKTPKSAQVSFTNLPIGKYQIQYVIDDKYAYFSNKVQQQLIVTISSVTTTNPQISYAGEKSVIFTGTGFDQNIDYTDVHICGFKCNVQSATFTELKCEAPLLRTASVLQQYPELDEEAQFIDPSQVTITGDDNTKAPLFFDLLQTTYYISNAATDCYVDLDFGSYRKFKLQQLRYTPRIDLLADYLKEAKFQYSTDGTTFTDFIVVDQTVHSGWNIVVPQNPIENIVKIRFTDSRGTSGSKCQLGDIELKGWITSNINAAYTTNSQCDAQISVNGQELQTVSNAVTYSNSATSTVTNVTPTDGAPNVQTEITITGTGFVEGSTTVFVDGIECTIGTVSTTQIICTTGTKDVSSNLLNGVFEVRVNGNLAVNEEKFIYANRWSDINTWGGYVFPGDGDSVIVNKGMTLIVDQLTPKLIQILVEGTLTFADEGPTSLNANYIIIREGTLRIGSPNKPHENDVTITLMGSYKDTQLPYFGNKVLACRQCKLDIHGRQVKNTWTLLSKTVNQGDTQITVDDDISDWKIGYEIFITSSEASSSNTEVKQIQKIEGSTIYLSSQLDHNHVSVVESYDDQEINMKVEVGLLSRNIKILGEKNSEEYGSHLIVLGEGSSIRISYTEIFQGGQPQFNERYPLYLFKNGGLQDSFIIGNSFHNNYARCIALNNVQYLKVQKNICHDTYGHGIFLEAGLETDNIIEDNLVSSVKSSWTLLRNDVSAASFYITNPQNIIRRNRASGSNYNGFWLDFKDNLIDSNICPSGMKILSFTDNLSHSNGHNGLYITKLIPRQSPCKSYRDDTKEDPFIDNPSIQTSLDKFITWKNLECGVYADSLGNVILQRFTVLDSNTGIQVHRTNYTKEETKISEIILVGQSQAAEHLISYARGLIVPQTHGFKVQNIKFYNFKSSQVLIESCSKCVFSQQRVQGGKNTFFENVKIFNSDDAQIIFWQNNKREVFWDLDGSLTKSSSQQYIIPYKVHLDGISGCVNQKQELWGNSMICDKNQVDIRDVIFNRPNPCCYQMIIQRISENNEGSYQTENSYDIRKSNDGWYSYVSPFAIGYTYEIQFSGSQDWLSLGIVPSYQFAEGDKGIVLRFPYKLHRETFDVFKIVAGTKVKQYSQIHSKPNPNYCENGQWYMDVKGENGYKYYYLCISGKGKSKYEYISNIPIYCRDKCESVGETELEEDFRYWTAESTWENNQIPVDGDTATIQAGYRVILDANSPKLKDLIIEGELIFDNKREATTLQAEHIIITTGKLIAGDSENPFPYKIDILLTGNKNQDLITSTKGIELYGLYPETIQSRLVEYCEKGDTQIKVENAEGWQVCDKIVIGPSGIDPNQSEIKEIKYIQNNLITLDTALEYDHFGDYKAVLKDDIGILDMRAAVGHLNRNIKILGKGEFCRIVTEQQTDPASGITYRGYAQLQGVEFDFSECEQKNYKKAAVILQNLNYQNENSQVQNTNSITKCSFHHSKGIMLQILQSTHVNVIDNIFYNGQEVLVEIIDSTQVQFQSNLLLHVTKGQSNKAVFGNFISDQSFEMIKDIFDVSNNVGQGSEDTGFYFMATPCSKSEQASFTQNQCSSAVQACYGVRESANTCMYFEGLHAYHAQVGIQGTLRASEMRINKVILIENKINLILKPGSDSIDDNVIKVTNSYISTLEREECKKCYFSTLLKPYCSNTIAIQLGSVTQLTYRPISQVQSLNFDQISSVSRLDLRVYIENLVFNNFRQTYKDFENCKDNTVFRQNKQASDQVGQHYLKNSQCINCEIQSKLYQLLSPDSSKLGFKGGCGSLYCTGLINALIEDQDGTFFGSKGQAIPNNEYLGPNVSYCTKIGEWNGYLCKENSLTVLNFMSTAPDYKKRLYSPIELSYGTFFNKLNSFKEWNWNGPEPLNQRESKFIGLVQLGAEIEMKTAGPTPTSSEYWLSKRTTQGIASDWIIIKLQFSQSQMVQVQVGNQIIKSGVTATGSHYDLTTMTHICGANNYYYETRAIHFVVNGALNCKVSLSLKNTLQVSTRLVITTQEFLREKFIQYAVALLGGDPYNYFILGVKLGNRRLLAEGEGNEIIVDWAYVDSAEIGTVEGSESKSKLEAVSAKLVGFQPTEVGKVISNTPKIESIEELNYESTESSTSDNPSTSTEPVVSTEPTTPTNSTTSSADPGSSNSQSTNSNNQNSQSNNSQQNSNSSYQQTKIPNNNNKEVGEDPPLIPDDSVPYVPPYYNNSTFKNNQNNAQNYQQDKDSSFSNQIRQNSKEENKLSQNLIIVIIIIGSIVLISITIAIYFWVKRVQAYKIVPANQQKENIPNIQQDLVIPEIEFESLSCTNKTL